MSAFAAMIATIFADPNMAADAVYTPASGDPVNCRAILRRGQTVDREFGRSGFGLSPATQTTAYTADIQRSEVDVPAKGATLTVAGRIYPVERTPELDELGLVWTLVLGQPT